MFGWRHHIFAVNSHRLGIIPKFHISGNFLILWQKCSINAKKKTVVRSGCFVPSVIRTKCKYLTQNWAQKLAPARYSQPAPGLGSNLLGRAKKKLRWCYFGWASLIPMVCCGTKKVEKLATVAKNLQKYQKMDKKVVNLQKKTRAKRGKNEKGQCWQKVVKIMTKFERWNLAKNAREMLKVGKDGQTELRGQKVVEKGGQEWPRVANRGGKNPKGLKVAKMIKNGKKKGNGKRPKLIKNGQRGGKC